MKRGLDDVSKNGTIMNRTLESEMNNIDSKFYNDLESFINDINDVISTHHMKLVVLPNNLVQSLCQKLGVKKWKCKILMFFYVFWGAEYGKNIQKIPQIELEKLAHFFWSENCDT